MKNIRLGSVCVLIFSILAQFCYTDFPLQKSVAYGNQNGILEDGRFKDSEDKKVASDIIATPSEVTKNIRLFSNEETEYIEPFSYELKEENGDIIIKAEAENVRYRGWGHLMLLFEGAEYVYGWSNLERGKTDKRLGNEYYNGYYHSVKNEVENPHVEILRDDGEIDRVIFAESLKMDYEYVWIDDETWKLVFDIIIKKPDMSLTGFAVESSFETNETEYEILHKMRANDLREAVRKSNSYTINFSTKNGQITESQRAVIGEDISLPPAPVKPGYIFVSWNTKEDASGINISDKEQLKNMVKRGESINLYAIWRPINYNIAYQANGGQGNMEASNFTYGAAAKLRKNKFTRSGYTYLNWNSKNSGDGTFYTDEQEVLNLSEQDNATINLYAVWLANTYKINLTLDKGEFISGNDKKKSINVDLKYDAPIGKLPVPVLEDYHFDAWYFDRELKNIVEENALLKIADNTSFYPKWSLLFVDNKDGTNKRGGLDAKLNTADDNLYTNGADGIAGNADDIKIFSGADKKYGTDDDYYYEGAKEIFKGEDKKYGTPDDYYLEEEGKVRHTRGKDLKFGTEDDKYYYEGTKEIFKGEDKKYGTSDDYYLEEEGKVRHTRGEDLKFGTEDDKYYYEGTKEIFKGEDKKYGTSDDYYLKEEGKVRHTRGKDLKFGTEDDKYYYEGTKEIFKGEDKKYGTSDDYYLEEEGKVRHTRGKDLKFGTEDDVTIDSRKNDNINVGNIQTENSKKDIQTNENSSEIISRGQSGKSNISKSTGGLGKINFSRETYVNSGPGVKNNKNIFERTKEIVEVIKNINIKQETDLNKNKKVEKISSKKKADKSLAVKTDRTDEKKSKTKDIKESGHTGNSLVYRKNKLNDEVNKNEVKAEKDKSLKTLPKNDAEEAKKAYAAKESNVYNEKEIYESKIEKSSLGEDYKVKKSLISNAAKVIKEKPAFVLSIFIIICSIPVLLFILSRRKKEK